MRVVAFINEKADIHNQNSINNINAEVSSHIQNKNWDLVTIYNQDSLFFNHIDKMDNYDMIVFYCHEDLIYLKESKVKKLINVVDSEEKKKRLYFVSNQAEINFSEIIWDRFINALKLFHSDKENNQEVFNNMIEALSDAAIHPDLTEAVYNNRFSNNMFDSNTKRWVYSKAIFYVNTRKDSLEVMKQKYSSILDICYHNNYDYSIFRDYNDFMQALELHNYKRAYIYDFSGLNENMFKNIVTKSYESGAYVTVLESNEFFHEPIEEVMLKVAEVFQVKQDKS
ncbi:hypothetical protein NDK47_23890 [Brevibacillus ruminantium]|uniref:Uncharacterized protein n=1 Tax=Brevibacillus ruminantium TaxID=2950604 RepID=A0ABY4WD77_9BACL|nr:hypothetical protein [Brevibacillus ruminantium]USG65128.1 hypothetical protein NDK47_23890 [Brevibacillus ruminantium]